LHPAFEADIYAAITPRQVVAARRSEGGTGFAQVAQQLERVQRRLRIASESSADIPD
jgi:argininosuccinate lyase